MTPRATTGLKYLEPFHRVMTDVLPSQVIEGSDPDGDSELILAEHGHRSLRWKRGSKTEEKVRKTFVERLRAGWAAFKVVDVGEAKLSTVSFTEKDVSKRVEGKELVPIRALPEGREPVRVLMTAPFVGG